MLFALSVLVLVVHIAQFALAVYYDNGRGVHESYPMTFLVSLVGIGLGYWVIDTPIMPQLLTCALFAVVIWAWWMNEDTGLEFVYTVVFMGMTVIVFTNPQTEEQPPQFTNCTEQVSDGEAWFRCEVEE